MASTSAFGKVRARLARFEAAESIPDEIAGRLDGCLFQEISGAAVE